jgi:hypothetical protein
VKYLLCIALLLTSGRSHANLDRVSKRTIILEGLPTAQLDARPKYYILLSSTEVYLNGEKTEYKKLPKGAEPVRFVIDITDGVTILQAFFELKK